MKMEKCSLSSTAAADIVRTLSVNPAPVSFAANSQGLITVMRGTTVLCKTMSIQTPNEELKSDTFDWIFNFSSDRK